MRKFIFSMQGILNARTARKEACEQALQTARMKLQLERKKLAEIEKQLKTAIESTPEQTACCSFFLQRERYVSMIKKQLVAQKVKTSAAETEVQVCMSRLHEADIELKKMEKLQEKEKERWQLEFQRHEQKLNDEIGTSRAFFRAQHN